MLVEEIDGESPDTMQYIDFVISGFKMLVTNKPCHMILLASWTRHCKGPK